MESIGHGPDPKQRRRRMQFGVGAEHPVSLSPFGGAVEVNHLAATVNARVGPAGAVHKHGMVGNTTQGRFYALLDGGRFSLALPTVELRSVVFNSSRQSHGRSTVQIPPSSSRARARLALDPPLMISSRRVRADSESSMER